MSGELRITLSRSQLEAARARLLTQGIKLVGDSGEVEGHKVGVKFSYDGISQLTIEIEHKPWLYPEAAVENEILKWFGTVQ